MTVLALWMMVFFGWWTHRAFTHYRFMQCHCRLLWQDTDSKLRDNRILVSLPIQIDNHSPENIDPTELKIKFTGAGVLDGRVKIQGPLIPSGDSSILQLRFETNLPESALLDLPEFLKTRSSAHLKFDPPLSQPVLFQIFPQ